MPRSIVISSPLEAFKDHVLIRDMPGERSLPQSLGGGDLDGDLYNLIMAHDLFPDETMLPGAYPTVEPQCLPAGRTSTIDDIADFVINFINNDYLGQIAMQNLYIADQSPKGSKDPDCILLAELASQAVDFAKSGIPADTNRIPRLHRREKPDWSAGETSTRDSENFYKSTRALGVLYRGVELPKLGHRARKRDKEGRKDKAPIDALVHLSLDSTGDDGDTDMQDEITSLVRPQVERHMSLASNSTATHEMITSQFRAFGSRLQYICANHSLSKQPLTEEECWAGTIVAKSARPRERQELQSRMREQSTLLVNTIRNELSEPEEAEEWLLRTWVAWKVSRHARDAFGARSYGYIALGSMFEALKELAEE